jgi:hypothetical protein
MSRKVYRSKKRRRALCRPDKGGWASRWSAKDLERLRAFDKAHNRGDWSRV